MAKIRIKVWCKAKEPARLDDKDQDWLIEANAITAVRFVNAGEVPPLDFEFAALIVQGFSDVLYVRDPPSIDRLADLESS